jgi:hypothetical protein
MNRSIHIRQRNKVKEATAKIRSHSFNPIKLTLLPREGTAGRETEHFIKHNPFDQNMIAVNGNELEPLSTRLRSIAMRRVSLI